MHLNLKGGVRIVLPDNLKSITVYVALEQEDWFENELHFVRTMAYEGMYAVDIGASFGFYTLALAKNTGDTGRVYSFEPNSSTRDYLQRSLNLNKSNNVNVFPFALSDYDGEGELYFPENSELGTIKSEMEEPNSKSEKISVRSLDSLHQELDFSGVEFIKIDAEGAEANIVNGGSTYLEQFSPLIMHEVKKGSVVDFTVCRKLEERGYENYRLIPALNCLVPINIEEECDDYLLNVFSCKPDRAKTLAQKDLLVFRETIPKFNSPNEIDWTVQFGKSPIGKLVASSFDTTGKIEIAEHDRYLRALNYYACSETENISLSDRVGALKFATSELTTINQNNYNFGRLCSLARVTLDYGLRSNAVAALKILINHINAGNLNIEEVFVPVTTKLDEFESNDHFGEWCAVSIVEQLIKLIVFSGIFGGDEYYELLKAIRGNKYASTEIERRWQLYRQLRGYQKYLGKSPQLTNSNPDHINPEFWRGQNTNQLN